MTIDADAVSLRELRIFSKVEAKRLKLVAMMADRLNYAPGEPIIREGEAPVAIYIVLTGKVELSRDTPCGQHHALSLGTGALFGDVPMLCEKAYIANATAVDHVVLLRLGKDLFFEMLETVPEFAVAVTRDIASRLYQLTARVLEVDTGPETEGQKPQ